MNIANHIPNSASSLWQTIPTVAREQCTAPEPSAVRFNRQIAQSCFATSSGNIAVIAQALAPCDSHFKVKYKDLEEAHRNVMDLDALEIAKFNGDFFNTISTAGNCIGQAVAFLNAPIAKISAEVEAIQNQRSYGGGYSPLNNDFLRACICPRIAAYIQWADSQSQLAYVWASLDTFITPCRRKNLCYLNCEYDRAEARGDTRAIAQLNRELRDELQLARSEIECGSSPSAIIGLGVQLCDLLLKIVALDEINTDLRAEIDMKISEVCAAILQVDIMSFYLTNMPIMAPYRREKQLQAAISLENFPSLDNFITCAVEALIVLFSEDLHDEINHALILRRLPKRDWVLYDSYTGLTYLENTAAIEVCLKQLWLFYGSSFCKLNIQSLI